jgi:hypothetical protein
MTWDQGDGKVCAMIRARRTGAQAVGNDYESFQRFVASLRDFERVGLVEQVRELQEHHTGHRYAAAASWKTHRSVLADSISTSQRRWLLLRLLAEKGEEDGSQSYRPTPEDFAGLAGDARRIEQAGQWLGNQGFVQWHQLYGGGMGRILDKGHDALDHGLEMLREKTPMQSIDQSINVGTLNAGSGDLAIGPGAAINKQVLANELTKLIRAIEAGPGDEGEKGTLISSLKSVMAHPMVTAIAGALTGAAAS